MHRAASALIDCPSAMMILQPTIPTAAAGGSTDSMDPNAPGSCMRVWWRRPGCGPGLAAAFAPVSAPCWGRVGSGLPVFLVHLADELLDALAAVDGLVIREVQVGRHAQLELHADLVPQIT